MNFERLKSEIARNKTKSMVLGGLVLVLGIVGGNMLLSNSPRSANASIATSESTVSAEAIRSGEMDAKVREAAALWDILKEKRGLSAATAFTFDPEHAPEDGKYVRDPSYRPPAVQSVETRPADPVTTPRELSADQREQLRQDRIKQEARQLVLQAILMGDQPTVLINSKRMGLGEEVEGFKISVVEERLVRVVKDGVEVTIPLKDLNGIKNR
jgi:hypothetical protein